VETAKVNVAIGNILPTVTYSPVPNFSVGASLVVGIQQFRGSGVVAPSPAGGLMGLPSHGTSYAFGVGGGVGVMWKPLPEVSLGASYFTKTRFSNLRGYKDDLLAGAGGHLDLPSRYGVGVAWRPVPSLTLALDYLRINWSDSAALGDPASFNWHDQNVVRIGAAWRVNPAWTIRAGFSRANSYADSNHTPANFYAAGINNRTVSVGASYAIDKTNELTFAFEYNIPRTLMGTGAGTGTNIHNALQVFTLGYSHKF
jgi:long-chain fatty acid transport protein